MKLLMLSLVSLIMIAAAIVLKLQGMSCPAWGLAVWNFYIFFSYGYLVLKGSWRRKRKRIFANTKY